MTSKLVNEDIVLLKLLRIYPLSKYYSKITVVMN